MCGMHRGRGLVCDLDAEPDAGLAWGALPFSIRFSTHPEDPETLGGADATDAVDAVDAADAAAAVGVADDVDAAEAARAAGVSEPVGTADAAGTGETAEVAEATEALDALNAPEPLEIDETAAAAAGAAACTGITPGTTTPGSITIGGNGPIPAPNIMPCAIKCGTPFAIPTSPALPLPAEVPG